jgi:hypothetical protein
MADEKTFLLPHVLETTVVVFEVDIEQLNLIK